MGITHRQCQPTVRHLGKYILVVVCGFSKWVEAFSIPNQEAETVARVLVRELFCRYGCPRVIHSDQGRNFESRLFKEVCRHMDIDKTRTTGYHPSGNGQVERFNKTLCSMMASFVSENQRDWDTVVPKVVFAYNTSRHETTGVTPFELLHGRPARLPLDVTCGGTDCPADKVCSPRELEDIRRKVTDAIEDAAGKRLSPKLQKPWTGPFEVIEVLSPQNYRLKASRGRAVVVHHDHLKPFMERRSSSPHCGGHVSGDAGGSEGEPDDVTVHVGGEGDDDEDDGDWICGYRRQATGEFEAVADDSDSQNVPERRSLSEVDATPVPSVTVQSQGDDDVYHESESSATQPAVEPVEDQEMGSVTRTGDGVTVQGSPCSRDGDATTDVTRRSTRKRSAPNRFGDWLYS